MCSSIFAFCKHTRFASNFEKKKSLKYTWNLQVLLVSDIRVLVFQYMRNLQTDRRLIGTSECSFERNVTIHGDTLGALGSPFDLNLCTSLCVAYVSLSILCKHFLGVMYPCAQSQGLSSFDTSLCVRSQFLFKQSCEHHRDGASPCFWQVGQTRGPAVFGQSAPEQGPSMDTFEMPFASDEAIRWRTLSVVTRTVDSGLRDITDYATT